MKAKPPLKNIAASVRDRLLNVMNEEGQDYNMLLTRYAVERFLFRLAASKYCGQFILKGAMLFAAWQHVPHRMTKDLDLLGFGDSSPERLKAVFAEICTEPVDDDGTVFDPASVETGPIRAEEAYVGVRVTLQGMLGRARLHVQVDVGFGDSFAVEPVMLKIPSLVGMPVATVRAYRMETSIAEKFEAAVTLGNLNTRMKDYFDLWHLAKSFAFNGQDVSRSIQATFQKRGSSLPRQVPTGFSDEFWSDPKRQAMWKSFWKKSVRTTPLPSLEEVTSLVVAFTMPPALAASLGQDFVHEWPPGGPWALKL